MVRGPWLSDPSYASVGLLLWTLKNFFKPYFCGLDDGMDALPRALAEGQDVRLGAAVLNVADLGDHVEIVYRQDGREHSERFARAVITTTTDQALAMFPQMSGVQRDYYEATEYIASVNTHLALSRRPDNPATYIMVSPRENPRPVRMHRRPSQGAQPRSSRQGDDHGVLPTRMVLEAPGVE